MSEAIANRPLIEVKGLKEYFDINMGFLRSKPLKAVDDVSFSINRGETLGLVGESGCGKTTVGRTILHLYKPTAGEIYYDSKLIKTKDDVRQFRTKASMVFQDPYSSLNPRMTVSDIVGEPLDVHHMYSSKKERDDRILELLSLVGLNSEHASRYAHEFSGGQRQRIGIARALAMKPEFIVCDEPVSALDVSIQAQVINMFDDLQDELGLTYLFIAHDLLRGAPHLRPHRRDVSGQDGRAGRRGGDLQSSAASVFAVVALGRAAARSQGRARQQAHRAAAAIFPAR